MADCLKTFFFFLRKESSPEACQRILETPCIPQLQCVSKKDVNCECLMTSIYDIKKNEYNYTFISALISYKRGCLELIGGRFTP